MWQLIVSRVHNFVINVIKMFNASSDSLVNNYVRSIITHLECAFVCVRVYVCVCSTPQSIDLNGVNCCRSVPKSLTFNSVIRAQLNVTWMQFTFNVLTFIGSITFITIIYQIRSHFPLTEYSLRILVFIYFIWFFFIYWNSSLSCSFGCSSH